MFVINMNFIFKLLIYKKIILIMIVLCWRDKEL